MTLALAILMLLFLGTPARAADQFALQTNLDHVWTMTAAGLVFLMQAGFLLLEAGQVRSKNSVNVAQKNLIDFILSTMAYGSIGFALMFGVSQGGWFGWSPDLLWFGAADNWSMTFFTFQVVFCGTAATIVSGAVAERMSMAGYMLITLLISLVIYPVAGHWVWGALLSGDDQPWLAAMGFLDFAGSTVVHSVGAWVSLAAIIVIGPRFGKFGEDGRPRTLHGHSPVLTTAGCVILWVGWIGFNGGSTTAGTGDFAGIIMATMISGAMGGVGGLVLGRLFDTVYRPEASVNGALAGLVGITAGCDLLDGGAAALVGLGAAAVAFFVARLLEYVFRLDDPLGAVAVHGGAGVFGTLVLALLADPATLPAGSAMAQLGVQLVGVATVFVWAFGLSLAVLGALRLATRSGPHPRGFLRVTEAFEREGLNVAEHGAPLGLSVLQDAIRTIADDPLVGFRHIEVDHGDEAYEVSLLFNRMIDNMDAKRQQDALADQQRQRAAQEDAISDLLRSEVGTVLERFAAGDFAARVPVQGKSGVLLQLSARINDLSEIVSEGLEDFSGALHCVVTGEGEQAMRRRYEGLLGQLQSDFETTVHQLGHAVRGMDRAVEAAAGGRFDQDIPLDGMTGVFARICDGMNRLNGTAETAMSEVQRVLGQMAEGDLTVRMQGDFSGRYDEIQQRLHDTASGLARTLVAVRMAAETNARLGAQGSDIAAKMRAGTEAQVKQMHSAETALARLTELSQEGKRLADSAATQSLGVQTSAEQGLTTAERTHANVASAEAAALDIVASIALVEDIARQTNLLSLNAAVEAARAPGHVGAGFKLVAEEVRSLASLTRSAVQTIRTRAEAMRDLATASSFLVNETCDQLRTIAGTAGDSLQVNRSLAQLGADQHDLVQEVGRSVASATLSSNAMAVEAEQSALSAAEISARAETTRALIASLRLDGPAATRRHAA